MTFKNSLAKLILLVAVGLFLNPAGLFAQDGNPVIPDTGGGGGDGGQVTNPDQGVPGDRNSNVDTEGGEGVGDLGNAVELDPIENNRNQGFVGATAPEIDNRGFIGRPGELTGPPLAENATFGGGTNTTVDSSVSIGGGQTPTATGVTVTRRNMRSNLRLSFFAPKPSSQQITDRFNHHFMLQPGFVSYPETYTVSMKNRTATVSGFVGTKADRDRLIRQLRLEPGVYKIVDQLKISD